MWKDSLLKTLQRASKQGLRSHFQEVVQNFELKRVGGAPKGHQLRPQVLLICSVYSIEIKLLI